MERYISVSRSQLGEENPREVLVCHMHEPVLVGYMHEPNNNDELRTMNHANITRMCKQYIKENRTAPGELTSNRYFKHLSLTVTSPACCQ